MSDVMNNKYLFFDQMMAELVEIVEGERADLLAQDQAFGNAMQQVNRVRDFISAPEHILGSPLTKHGEIAEQVEVGIRNARSALSQQPMTASDLVGRTAPEDYIIDGVQVQSKFINGTSQNLEHVLGHMHKYDYFGRDGSFYHIPKDHYEIISKVLSGESVPELSTRSVNVILEKVKEIEFESGKPFNEVVQPSISTYSEVQQGMVHATLDQHEQDFVHKNTYLNERIHENHATSLINGMQVTAIATSVGAALSLSAAIYSKYKDGKNLFKGEFTDEDWKSIGLTGVKGASIGGVTGLSIYLLTGYAEMAAPIAGAVVSSIKGVSSLLVDYQAGRITFDQFIDLGLVVCSESAVVGLTTLAGQALIPIPMLGAVIGSLAGKFLAEFVLIRSKDMAQRIQQKMKDFLVTLDTVEKKLVAKINAEYDRLEGLAKIAFDFEYNHNLLMSSINLAKAHGVEDNLLIHNHVELDNFILS